MTEQPSVFQMEKGFGLSFSKMSECIRAAYQPIVSNAGLRLAGYEALARQRHPDLESVPPAVFVENAEKTGRIGEITSVMLQKACAECAEWGDGFVSVNISAADLRREELPDLVAETLEAANLHPSRLQVEVTETLAVSSRSGFAVLNRIKNLGVMTAMDDFGTGHASDERLLAHDWDKVKLDGSVVRTNLEAGNSGLDNLQYLSSRLRRLGHQVVAEGVETEEQIRLLRQIESVDYLQGYALGRPQLTPHIPLRVTHSAVP